MVDAKDFCYELEEQERGYTVRDFIPDEQPREKALKYGIHTLTTSELWALILRTGIPGRPITRICSELMRVCNGRLLELERLDSSVIEQVPGFGPAKMLQMKAVFELSKRYIDERPRERKLIQGPNSIYEEMRYEIGNLSHEEIWALFLNQKNELMAKQRITQGSAIASVFDLKKVIKMALLLDAQAVVMCHNHPSGNLLPSPQDEDITRRLQAACKTMELRLLDHLIVTSGGFYSFRDHGKIY